MYRELIRERYEHLSKSQKRIADYLMVSPREAAFMTASRLAGILNVDIATVTRFAQRLTFHGYPELLADVRSTVRLEMSSVRPPMEGVSDAGRAFVSALAGERDNIERTINNISIDAVERAIDALLKAETIYVAAQHLTDGIVGRFQLLGMRASGARGAPAFLIPGLVNATSKDVLLATGYSSVAYDVVAAMRIVRERGATIIGLTGSEVSPVARLAQIVIICSMASPVHLPAESSVMAVVEGMWQALANLRQEQLGRNLRDLDRYVQDMVRDPNSVGGSVEDNILPVY